MSTAPTKMRFHDRVVETPLDGPTLGCWFWTGAINAAGYGVVRAGQHLRLAHHVSVELSGIVLPEATHQRGGDIVVRHRCHATRSCVRPDHLVVDAAETNREDARIMGRYRGPRPAPGGDHAARSRAVRDALRDGYDEDALVIAIAGERLFSWREAPIVPALLPT